MNIMTRSLVCIHDWLLNNNSIYNVFDKFKETPSMVPAKVASEVERLRAPGCTDKRRYKKVNELINSVVPRQAMLY
jgi:hypothetical protein